jgi:hypothetical protein
VAFARVTRRPLTHAMPNNLIKPLGQDSVLLAPLLRDDRFGHGSRTLGVPGNAGLDEVHEKIGACHRSVLSIGRASSSNAHEPLQ